MSIYLFFIFYYIVFALFPTYIISFSPPTLFFPISTFSYVSYFMRLSLNKMTIKKQRFRGAAFYQLFNVALNVPVLESYFRR